MDSTFAAISVWNLSRASVSVGSSSLSRYCRTALTSSTAVGRSCMAAASVGALDQVEQFQLHLRGAPAETCQLDAHRLAGKVAVGLLDAADRPAEVAEDFPVREGAA